MENRRIKYLMYGIIMTLIVAITGVTYAFFRGTIQGEGADMSVTLNNVHILFTDDTEIADNNAQPGWSTSKRFTVENQGTTDFSYDIYIKDFVNTLVTEGYFQYKITSTNGYNMSDFEPLPRSNEASNFDLATEINIPGGVLQEYTIEFRYLDDPNVDQSEDMGANFSGQLMIEAQKSLFNRGTLARKILDNATTINTRTDFDNVLGDATATTGVLYKESVYRETPESTRSSSNNKDVYYFAGNVADNWVSFGGYIWRIIRTNEDGSVRLLFHGTSTTATNSYIASNPAYNEERANTMYVGYMYGTTGNIRNNRKNTTSSNVKTVIDDWYKNNILSSYDGYVSKTAIYCNDRASSHYYSNGMIYAAYYRLHGDQTQKRQPTYQCGQNSRGGYYKYGGGWIVSNEPYIDSPADVADRFSVDKSSGGNGQLEYGVALMTADEISFAGGKYENNAPNAYYYLNSSGGSSTAITSWWTMSPVSRSVVYGSPGVGGGSGAKMFLVGGSSNYPGRLEDQWLDSLGYGVRPVLSLKSCVEWVSGNGTAESPYTVSVSDTCSAAVN